MLPGLLLASLAMAGEKTATFTVSAEVVNGCVFGSSSAASAAPGTLDFGTLADLSSHVDATSVSGAGSIVVTCTPGTSLTIAFDNGSNGGDSSARYLSNGSGTQLAYQLYQDAAHASVWGSGALAYSIASFPATAQTLPVYGRLFASGTAPAAGTYSDTVTVTLTW